MQVSRLVRLGVAPRLNPRYLFERALEYPSVAREDVGLEGLVVRVDHPDVLFAVEPRSVARGSASAWRRRGRSCTVLLVTSGSAAFSSTTSLTKSNPLGRGGLSAGTSPRCRYFVTVFRSIPCLRATSLKFGLAPVCLYIFTSPIASPPSGPPFERRMLRWLGWVRPIGAALASGEFAIIFVLTKTPPSALRLSWLP